ncbi:MAG: SDR family NAD(P)-dependent oxidoreductase [Gammaproteobacteria bacterium]
MSQRIFSSRDQTAFAQLSGDYNPLHVDQIAARRLIFGRPVVHGIHSLLWALDIWLKDHVGSITLRSIKASFRKPIGVREKVTYMLVAEGQGHVEIQLIADGSAATVTQFDWAPSIQHAPNPAPGPPPERQTCRELSAREIQDASGQLRTGLDVGAVRKVFSGVGACLPLQQIAEILTTTRLVGMECPGLHSIYSELELNFSGGAGDADTMRYQVEDYDTRFNLATIAVAAPGMKGRIKAFRRPAPEQQVRIADLISQTPDFSQQRALIVGGSRGLGEVTAKLLAAGGAEVKLTYHQGKHDAQQVVEEIVASGGCAESIACDVLHPELSRQLQDGWHPTHVYYFATPHIFASSKGSFSPTLFNRFCEYYVTGFANTVSDIRAVSSELMCVFYPSSVAVDELPSAMGEYAAAKRAGETLCEFLEKTQKEIVIYKPRLPRMATDQTVSLVPVLNHDPVEIMLRHLEELREMGLAR